MGRKPIKVALLGCGTVGAEVIRLLHGQADELAERIGAPLELVGVAVQHLGRDRSNLPIDPALFTDDAESLVRRPDVDILVELVGGLEPARGWLLEGLLAGRSVVTGNKALIAEDGPALYAAAAKGNADLYYEAAVASAIPLLRPLRESLHGDRITRIVGIVNGTTNFILSSMEATGASFAAALEEATALGYAEADPTADIEGFDAAAKAAILASLAFHTTVTAGDVSREGITAVTAADMARAKLMGRTIKLLCVAERHGDAVNVRVHPALIPRTHPLGGVSGPYNAVLLDAAAAGELMFYGHGAGGAAAASAILGDIVGVARNRISGVRPSAHTIDNGLRILPIGEAMTRYCISMEVADRVGVLAEIAGVFAQHGVSIATVDQAARGDRAGLVVVTHTAADADLSATVADLRELSAVRSVSSVLRVEL